MHLGFHIYDVGFQSQNSEAAKPMVFTTTLLLIAIIAVLNVRRSGCAAGCGGGSPPASFERDRGSSIMSITQSTAERMAPDMPLSNSSATTNEAALPTELRLAPAVRHVRPAARWAGWRRSPAAKRGNRNPPGRRQRRAGPRHRALQPVVRHKQALLNINMGDSQGQGDGLHRPVGLRQVDAACAASTA